MKRRLQAIIATLGIAILIAVPVAFNAADGATNSNTVYACFDANGIQTTRHLQLTVPVCATGNHWESWQSFSQPDATSTTTSTTLGTTTTTGATTTTAPTTTTQPTTTTTQPSGGTPFMGYPLQPCTLSISGQINVNVSNKSWRGCRGVSAVVISNSTNVTLTNLDFDSNSGDIFLINDSGTISVNNIRARNTGAGRTTNGSGQGEVIQLNNTFQGAPSTNTTAGLHNINNYGGNTEDMISIFESGGLDASHPLVISGNHLESPLPNSADGALAWTSGSGTCINAADGIIPGSNVGGHDIIVTGNTLLNCGQAGLMMNNPLRVTDSNNIVYGAARASSNVGITQWASSSCSACINNFYTNNQVFWQKADGTASPWWLSGNAQVTIDAKSKTQDPTTPQVHVTL